MKSTTFVLLQALALGALAAPSPAPKDTPPFNWHKGLTREQEGRELNPPNCCEQFINTND
jgi:hypothetical protein